MSSFFQGTSRRVTIGVPSLLGGKGKPRRIRVALTFPLSGESFVSVPDWLSESFDAVSQFQKQASPATDVITDVALVLVNPAQQADGALFESEPAKIPSAELRKLTILRMGEADDQDVVLTCSMYADFSRAFWKWLGEYAHNEVHAKFPSSKEGLVEVAPTAEQPDLIPAAESAKNVAEFFSAPAVPEEGPGSEQFEAEVRASMGAPEPLSEAPRLVRHDDPDPKPNGKGNKTDKAKSAFKEFHEKEVAKGRTIN